MIPLSTTSVAQFALIIITGTSNSSAMCSSNLNPSMSGMCTSDSTMSKSRRRSRSAVSASAPRVNVVTGVWLKGGGG